MYSYQQTASGQQRPGGDETRPHTLNSRNEILYIAIPEVYPFRYLMMMIHITQTRTKKNTPPPETTFQNRFIWRYVLPSNFS